VDQERRVGPEGGVELVPGPLLGGRDPLAEGLELGPEPVALLLRRRVGEDVDLVGEGHRGGRRGVGLLDPVALRLELAQAGDAPEVAAVEEPPGDEGDQPPLRERLEPDVGVLLEGGRGLGGGRPAGVLVGQGPEQLGRVQVRGVDGEEPVREGRDALEGEAGVAGVPPGRLELAADREGRVLDADLPQVLLEPGPVPGHPLAERLELGLQGGRPRLVRRVVEEEEPVQNGTRCRTSSSSRSVDRIRRTRAASSSWRSAAPTRRSLRSRASDSSLMAATFPDGRPARQIPQGRASARVATTAIASPARRARGCGQLDPEVDRHRPRP